MADQKKPLWSTIQIKVPNEMLEITKKGRVTKRKTLTRTLNLSKAQKQSAITLIPADIQKAEIIHEGKLYNINDLRGSMRESNQKKEEAQTKKADEKQQRAQQIANEQPAEKQQRANDTLRGYIIRKIGLNPVAPANGPQNISPAVARIKAKCEAFKKIGRKLSKSPFVGNKMIGEINYILLMKKHNVSCIIKNNRAAGIDSILGLGIPVFNGLHAILPEDLGTQLRGCIQRGNRTIVIPIGLPGHANLLIYRPTLKKVERFEPHGFFLIAMHNTQLNLKLMLISRNCSK